MTDATFVRATLDGVQLEGARTTGANISKEEQERLQREIYERLSEIARDNTREFDGIAAQTYAARQSIREIADHAAQRTATIQREGLALGAPYGDGDAVYSRGMPADHPVWRGYTDHDRDTHDAELGR